MEFILFLLGFAAISALVTWIAIAIEQAMHPKTKHVTIGTCGRVVRSLFPHGVEDFGNMKPSHHRQDDDPFPSLIQASSFGRTRAIFRMVEYNPLVGLYPPDDMNKKERRRSALGVEALRKWMTP